MIRQGDDEAAYETKEVTGNIHIFATASNPSLTLVIFNLLIFNKI
jgi:hypothetical protein